MARGPQRNLLNKRATPVASSKKTKDLGYFSCPPMIPEKSEESRKDVWREVSFGWYSRFKHYCVFIVGLTQSHNGDMKSLFYGQFTLKMSGSTVVNGHISTCCHLEHSADRRPGYWIEVTETHFFSHSQCLSLFGPQVPHHYLLSLTALRPHLHAV